MKYFWNEEIVARDDTMRELNFYTSFVTNVSNDILSSKPDIDHETVLHRLKSDL